MSAFGEGPRAAGIGNSTNGFGRRRVLRSHGRGRAQEAKR